MFVCKNRQIDIETDADSLLSQTKLSHKAVAVSEEGTFMTGYWD